ncbi:hypothetical protein N0V82_007980 [Gnomoniopsis sp. IMI 355080]|nr:hypothetical protein N0V82_007980 [Gnomoniopsis sp. IMI 355080]
MLDNRNSEALSAIIDDSELHFEGQAEKHAVSAVIGRAQKAMDAVIRVDIHICGPLSRSEDVRSHLTDHKIWLQRPTAPKFPYHNPQKIVFPYLDCEQRQVPVGGSETNERQKKQSAEEFQIMIADVYDALKRDKNLNKVEGNTLIKTRLME